MGRELVLGGASGIPARWKPGESSARPLGTPAAGGTSEAGGAGTGAGLSAIRDLDVPPDGPRVAAAGSDGTVTVTDLASGAGSMDLRAHTGATTLWQVHGENESLSLEERRKKGASLVRMPGEFAGIG